tara:strand:+ start:78 stop:488 length:411 start_codon:yes stop_codon:yes gene_type:complete
MNISKQVVILSAELAGLSRKENDKRSNTLEHCLQDCNLNFNEAIGVYKGKEEKSFVVIVNNEDEAQGVKEFAFLNFNQESVLVQDANQEAYLEFGDGSSQRLGILSLVPKEIAQVEDNYTILNGEYYITQKRIEEQ